MCMGVFFIKEGGDLVSFLTDGLNMILWCYAIVHSTDLAQAGILLP